MCFNNSQNVKVKRLAERYGRKSDIAEIYSDILDEQYRMTAYSHPPAVLVTADDELQVSYWGLIPRKVKTADYAEKIQNMTINARSENLFTAWSYRDLIMSNRCIIPSTGYYEYHHKKINGRDTALPYFIYLKGEEIFSIGGLYDIWKDPDTDNLYHTYTMITTPANEFSGAIHNGGKNPFRMPFLIPKSQEEKWLDPALSAQHVEEMLVPFAEENMEAYEISKEFRKMDPHDPDNIQKTGNYITGSDLPQAERLL